VDTEGKDTRTSRRGGCRHNVERRTYDRSDRYARLANRRPTPRFGVRTKRVEAFIDAFLTEREAAGLSPETLRSYVSDLGVFAAWLRYEDHPHDPAEWDAHLLRAYVAYLQRKPNKNAGGRISAMTVRSYTSRLLAFLRWLHVEGYTPVDFAAKLRKPQATQRVIQPLTPEESARLADAAKADPRCGVRDLAILYIMLDSGLRASEVCGLRPPDVLWDQRLVKVLGKGGKERVVPISPPTAQAMRRYLLSADRHDDRADTLFQTEEGWALTPHGLHHIVKKVALRAGVEGVHPHRLRHTAAIAFLRNGGNVLVLQRILGHTTLAMTNRYVALASDDVQREHDRCSPIVALTRP
jgi:site-specific recombinase XerD